MPNGPGYDEPLPVSLSSGIALTDQPSLSAIQPRLALAARTQRLAAMPVILPILLAFSASSVPLITPNPTSELRRSGAASVWALDRRRAQRISLRDARLLALRILAATETRLREERSAEFKFFLTFEEDYGAFPG